MANSAPATDSAGDFYCGGQAETHSLHSDLVDLMDGKTEVQTEPIRANDAADRKGKEAGSGMKAGLAWL